MRRTHTAGAPGRIVVWIQNLLIAPLMRRLLTGIIAVSIVFALLSAALAARIWKVDYELDAQAVHHVRGVGYTVVLKRSLGLFRAYGDSGSAPQASTGILFEDEVKLGPPHTLHESIWQLGLGRYSHWKEQVYFSSSDNSDPRVNGRRYSFSTYYVLDTDVLTVWVLLALLSGFLLLLGTRLQAQALGPLLREIGNRLTGTEEHSLILTRSGFARRAGSMGVGMPVLAGFVGTLFAAAVFWVLAVWPGLAADQSLLPVFLQMAGVLSVLGGVVLFLFANGAMSPPAVASCRVIFGLLGAGAALLCLGSLTDVWWRAGNTESVIAGVIPYNDANGYWAGGLRLLYNDTLDYWNMRRPVNAAMHAVRLWITGGDLWGSIGLQTMAALATMVVATVLLSAHMGILAGAAFFALCWFYMAPFFPTTLSSAVGFTFSTLGFAMLVAAAKLRGPWLMALGACLISLGLNARAGAFFILPFLLVVAWVIFGPSARTRLVAVCAVLAGIAVGFAVPKAYSSAWGAGVNTAHSNFSYTLYGIAAGGKGWQQIYVDRPDIFQEGGNEGVTSAKIYAAAKQKLYAEPSLFVGFVAGELARFPDFASGLLSIGAIRFGAGGQVLLALGLLGTLLAWRDPLSVVLLLGFLGVWASAPFIMQDGGPRVFGSSFPFIAAIAANGIGVLRRVLIGLAVPADKLDDLKRTDRLAPPVLHVLAAFGLVATLLPFAVGGTARYQAIPTYDCPSDTIPIATEPGRIAVWLNVLSEEPNGFSQRSSLSRDALQSSVAFRGIEIGPAILAEPPPYVLVAGLDLLSSKTGRGESFIAVLSGSRQEPPQEPVVICASSSHLPESMAAWRGYLYRATRVWPAQGRQ